MNFEAAENEIVDLLTAHFAAAGVAAHYEARPMPETEAEYLKAPKKTRATVQYLDSTFDPPGKVNIISQIEKPRFRLTIQAKKLRGEGGLYSFLDHLKAALVGVNLTGATGALHLVNYGFLEFQPNSLQPFIEFECKTVVQQVKVNTEQIGGDLKGLTAPNSNV